VSKPKTKLLWVELNSQKRKQHLRPFLSCHLLLTPEPQSAGQQKFLVRQRLSTTRHLPSDMSSHWLHWVLRLKGHEPFLTRILQEETAVGVARQARDEAEKSQTASDATADGVWFDDWQTPSPIQANDLRIALRIAASAVTQNAMNAWPVV